MQKLIRLSLLIPFLFITGTSIVNAKSFEFVNGDGSNKSEVCVAATISKSSWENKAGELQLGDADLQSFTCNGYPIEEFGNQYRGKQQSDESAGPVKVFAFTTDTVRVAAELCIAGSTDNVSLYNAMKKTKTPKNNMYLVRCNGMSIKRFSKKFGNKKYRI